MFHMKQSTQETLETLNKFAENLFKWNEKLNLTSYTKKEFFEVGVYDCNVLLQLLISLKITEIADVGTGYGMPGMVLKIFRPQLDLVLIDSSQKKVAFLEYISKILKLELQIFNKRLPDSKWNRQFGCIVSKASMQEGQLLKVAQKHLKKEGMLLYFHGTAAPIKSDELPLVGAISYKRANKTVSQIILRKKI